LVPIPEEWRFQEQDSFEARDGVTIEHPTSH
jgi:hypothetical protein